MPLEEICALDVKSIATPDAMLFLWAPPAFIEKGLLVLRSWGFELATTVVWVKDKIGTGYYFRSRHEHLILGKRGQPITPRPGSQSDSVIMAPRREHSAKPEALYDIIERMYPGLPRVELFARGQRAGWDVWGNQAADGIREIARAVG
jgi:N6-adenosine-specific RNA methylase IME4